MRKIQVATPQKIHKINQIINQILL